MKGKFTPLYFLGIVLVMGLLVGFMSQMGDPNADTAPVTDNTPGSGFEADTIRPANFPYPTAFNFNYSAIAGPNSGTVGAIMNGSHWIFNKWNTPNMWYRWNNNGPTGGPGTFADSTTYPGAIRDLTNGPGGFVYGGSATNQLRRINPATGATMATFTTAGAIYRAVAYDPNRKGFWNCDFGGNITCYDTAGVLKGTITTIATAKYGLAFDSTSTADSAWLWVWNQGPGGTAATTAELYKYHVASGTLKATYIFNLTGPGVGIAGGAECMVVNNKFILALNFQNQATVGYVLKDMTPPPPAGNTLVITNDSTVATNLARRIADRDTLKKYLPMLTGNITYMTKNAATVFPPLAGYANIIIQETAFDGTLILSAAQRTAIKDWLATGTPGAKKSLINIGGDFGYAYDRTGSANLDTVFSRSFGGFQYLSDDAGNTGFNGTYMMPSGGVDNMSITPPGGGFWPDGCRPVSGGVAFSRYMNRGAADSLAGITKTTANWNVITINQDPRYYTGTGATPSPDQGFKRVLSQAINWVKANGGVITGVTPISTVASDYKLSQNYPNPFNPATKINFSIPKSGLTTLKVYDILGKEVATLVNEVKTVGSYVVDFNASNLASGAYFYRLEVNGFVDTKKMLLIK